MKLILKFTAIVFFLSNTLMAQEDISRPKKIDVWGHFNPRGGISTVVESHWPE